MILTYQFIRNNCVDPGNKMSAVIPGQVLQIRNGAELALNGSEAQGVLFSAKDCMKHPTEMWGLNSHIPMRLERNQG